MDSSESNVILISMVYIIYGFFFTTLMVRSWVKKNHIPWYLFLVFIGVMVINAGITINNVIRIGAIWPILLVLLAIKRRELNDYNFQRARIFYSLRLGFLCGLLLLLTYIGLYKAKFVIIEPAVNLPTFVYLFRFLEVVIGEEVLFRGFILGELKRQGFSNIISIFLQGFLFSVAHISRYNTLTGLPILLLVTILGLVCGYISNREKNLTGAIITHAIFNLVPFFS